MAVNLEYLKQVYFTFDQPVPYSLGNKILYIAPIKLKDSNLFLSAIDILNIDKNSCSDVKIIQMSYLQFLCERILNGNYKTKQEKDLMNYKFYIIMNLCLGIKSPVFYYDNNVKLYDSNNPEIIINAKQFEEIKKIIMYQNIVHYDDSYINPELKQVMFDVDEVKNKDLQVPDLERQIAIITSHCGLSKKEQIDMTYRSHSLLFEEVSGEVEFETIRPVALISGSSDKLEHWIFKKKKNKFKDYVETVDAYTKNIGGNNSIRTSNNVGIGDSYMKQYNNFNKN